MGGIINQNDGLPIGVTWKDMEIQRLKNELYAAKREIEKLKYKEVLPNWSDDNLNLLNTFEVNPECGCQKCNPKSGWMILCPICGNKRCPKANWHENACTDSNAPGQKGSSWENYPKFKKNED